MSLPSRPRLAALMAAGLVAAAAAPAGAWERPQSLTPPSQMIDGPYLAVHEDAALLAWSRGLGSTEEWGLPERARVEASERAAGDTRWSPSQVLSPAAELGFLPIPVVLRGGGKLVAWTTARRGEQDLTRTEATRTPEGWSVTAVDADGDFFVLGRDTAPDGSIAVAQFDLGESYWDGDVRIARRDPGGGWASSPPLAVKDFTGGDISILPDGRVMLVGLRRRGGVRVTATAWDPATGSWSPARTAGALPGGAEGVDSVALPDGSVVAAFRLQARGPGRAVQVTFPADGGPGRVAGLGVTGSGDPRIARGDDGRVVVAWDSPDGIRLRTRAPGGGWSRAVSPPRLPCVDGGLSLVSVAAAPDGADLVVFGGGGSGDYDDGLPAAVLHRPDGSWSRPVWLAPEWVTGTTTAFDTTGRAHVAWQTYEATAGAGSRVQATSADAADVERPAVRQLRITRVTGVRVLTRNGTRAVRFRAERAGAVEVVTSPTRWRKGLESRERTIRARAGVNTVALVGRGAPLDRGRWVVTVDPRDLGCAVTSRSFAVRRVSR